MTLYNPSLSSSSASLRAAAPFDSKDADVVLRSSDNVDFRVHKSILKLASPVLAALISLTPLPPSAPRRHRRRRVVPLAEPGESLDLFLRFIYPVPEPPLSLDEVATLLELAHKYDSPSVTSRMRPHLLRPDDLHADPLQVYALASYAGMDDVARTAALFTLPHPLPHPAQLAETRLLPGPALVRVLEYRRRCVEAATRVARIADDGAVPSWVQLRWRRFCFLSECSSRECAKLPRRTLRWDRTLYGCVDVPEYWVAYMDAVADALEKSLDPGVARSRALVRGAAEAGVGCARCAGRVGADLEEFAEIVEAVIEEAISSVSSGSQWGCLWGRNGRDGSTDA